jgi:hypothetical protein
MRRKQVVVFVVDREVVETLALGAGKIDRTDLPQRLSP